MVNNLNSGQVQNAAFHLNETRANQTATHGPTHGAETQIRMQTRPGMDQNESGKQKP